MINYITRNGIGPTVCGIALCVMLTTSCSPVNTDQKAEHVQTKLPIDSANVMVTVLKPTDFKRELISNGTLTAADKADLRFETPEIVAEIFVKNGQRVAKGQKIAALAQFKLQNAMNQAHDNLEKAKLELQDVLISQGYTVADSMNVPPETLTIAKVKSNYEQSSIQYNLAQYNLDNAVLYAPFDGVVANLFSKEHNLPPTTEPFCTVIGHRVLEADFSVLENELTLINTGDPIKLSPFALNDYTVAGKITEINPMVDENGMVRMKARVQAATDRLYDGMHVKVRIQQSAGTQLVIPKTALVLRNNRKVVFTAQNGKAIWNYVQTGLENSMGYVVTEGLRAGDSVIYDGNLNLAHETPIGITEKQQTE